MTCTSRPDCGAWRYPGDDPPHRFKDDDIVPAAHEAKADRSVLAFDGAILAQTATERVREVCSRFQRHRLRKPTTGIAGCCARAANGQGRRAAGVRNEFPSPREPSPSLKDETLPHQRKLLCSTAN
jgi:hypothetical protein